MKTAKLPATGKMFEVSDIVDALVLEFDIPRATLNQIVKEIVTVMSHEVASGSTIKLKNFASFYLGVRIGKYYNEEKKQYIWYRQRAIKTRISENFKRLADQYGLIKHYEEINPVGESVGPSTKDIKDT